MAQSSSAPRRRPTRPPTLLDQTSYLAGRLARIGRRPLAAALAEHDLRPPHYAVLTALNDYGPLRQHELADSLDINRSHLVGYLDRLERRELVRRERDPEDRRRQHVVLTETGRALAHRMLEVATRSEDDYLATLTESQRQTLTVLLRRVVFAADRTADDTAIDATDEMTDTDGETDADADRIVR